MTEEPDDTTIQHDAFKRPPTRPTPEQMAAIRLAKRNAAQFSNDVVRNDKHWLTTGNVFIPTSRGGQPSGLAIAAPNSEYTLNLLDKKGASLGRLVLDSTKLSDSLSKLAKSGDITKMTVGDDKGESGYLVPIPLLHSIFQTMAGMDTSIAPRKSKNNTPIIITTDGSFRSGGKGVGAGGGHVILERRGSKLPSEDFKITLTWEADIKDSTGSEVRGPLEALKYLAQGNKGCNLIIRCDNMSVVRSLNAMGQEFERTGEITNVPANSSKELWKQVAELLKDHQSFDAAYAKYNSNDPYTRAVHDGAYNASKRWQEGRQGPTKKTGRG